MKIKFDDCPSLRRGFMDVLLHDWVIPIFMLLVIVGAIVLVGTLIFHCFTCKPHVYDSPVKVVGGCDKFGECGVMLEDGTYLRNIREPVPGIRIEVCQ